MNFYFIFFLFTLKLIQSKLRILPQFSEDSIQSDRITEISLEHNYLVTQNQSNITIKFTKPQGSTYLNFELRFIQKVNNSIYASPLLMLNKDYPAYITQINNYTIELHFEYSDLNGYYQDKNYRFVSLNPSTKDEIWYATILTNEKLSGSYIYQISTQYSSFKTCPQSCNNQGQCISGTCQCNANYIDSDCSKQALQIKTIGKWNQITLRPQVFNYIYYQITPNLEKVIILQFQKDKLDSFSLFFNIEGTLDSDIPNDKEFNQYYLFNSQDSELIIKLDQNLINYNQTRKLMIGLISKQSLQSFNVKFQIVLTDKSSDSNDEEIQQIMTILGLACSVLVVLSCTFMCCVCKKRGIMHLSSSRANLMSQQQAEEKQYLELLNLYIPSKFFDEIKVQEQITHDTIQCAVCLTEIQLKDLCRKTICGHYFHKDCIDPWILKHKNCPMCRQTLTKEDFEKFNQQNEKEIQKKLFQNINKCTININPIQQQLDINSLKIQQDNNINKQQLDYQQQGTQNNQVNSIRSINNVQQNSDNYIQMNDFQVGDVIGNETVFIDQQQINSDSSPTQQQKTHQLNISDQLFLNKFQKL